MILLRLISWPYVRKHRLRCVLTTMGIVLGVAIFVGMHAAGASVLSALNSTIDRIAGKTQLQITSGESGFPEEVLERVQALPEVAVAEPVIEAAVRSGVEREGNLLILGIDMTGDRSLREYDLEAGDQDVVDDPLVFLAQADSLIVTRDFAQRNALTVGSRITMQTMEGERSFCIRGIMRPGGISAAFGGNLAIMDIYAAQKVLGRGRRFDRLDVRLKDTYSLSQGQAALGRVLGPGFQVDVPAARSRQFDSLLHVYSFMVNLTSLFALFVGLFIIHNTFVIAVTERRSEIGILRALGTSSRQIRSLFLIESAIAGVIGSATGIVVGSFVARAMAGFIGDIMQAHYGIAERAHEIRFERGLIVSAVAMGVVTSMVAALFPARDAARVDPVRALQKRHTEATTTRESSVRIVCAGVFVLLALVCVASNRSRLVFYAGYLSFVSAALLLTPTLSRLISRLFRGLLTAVRPVEGGLAANSLAQAPRRTSATVAALMLSVGLVVSLGGLSRGVYESVVDWVGTFLSSDLLVLASEDGTNRNFHFPDSLTASLSSLAGVADVQRMRSNKVSVKSASVLLVAIDMATATAPTSGRIVSGDFEQMYRLAAQGKGAIISENCGLLQNIGMGDTLEIPSPSGIVRLPVVGIVTDYLNQSGTVFVDYKSVYLPFWRDPTVDMYKVYLKHGASAEKVKQEIQSGFAQQRRMFVMLNREVRARVMSNTGQWLGLSYIQIAVAIVVAILGIANTLLVSVTDRRREFATLRAIGAFRNQVRHSVWLEATSIAAIGTVLGIIFGAIDLLYERQMVRHDYAGLSLSYQFPWHLVLVLSVSVILAAWFSALAASEIAARNSIVEALEYE
jgi:putative ABC transport system permease protein